MEFFLRQIYPWLIEVSSASVLLPFFVALFFIRNQRGLLFKLLFLWVTHGLIQEALGRLTVYLKTGNNIWIHHVATPIEFGLLAAIYYLCFQTPLVKKGVLAAVLIVILLSIYDAVVLDALTQMNSLPKVVANSFIITMAISYFYKVANDQKTIYLDQDPIFLLSCGVLIFYSGTTMSWTLFNDALAVSYDAARICIAITLVLNILFHSWLAFVFRRMAA